MNPGRALCAVAAFARSGLPVSLPAQDGPPLTLAIEGATVIEARGNGLIKTYNSMVPAAFFGMLEEAGRLRRGVYALAYDRVARRALFYGSGVRESEQ